MSLKLVIGFVDLDLKERFGGYSRVLQVAAYAYQSNRSKAMQEYTVQSITTCAKVSL